MNRAEPHALLFLDDEDMLVDSMLALLADDLAKTLPVADDEVLHVFAHRCVVELRQHRLHAAQELHVQCSVARALSDGRDTESLQDRVRARAAGLQPDLVQPQDVAVGVRVRHLATSLSTSTSRWNFCASSRKTAANARPRSVRAQVVRQRAVGAAAHRDVVVDVDELAREALREESGDEQRDVAEPLQRFVALLRRRRLGASASMCASGLRRTPSGVRSYSSSERANMVRMLTT